MQKTYVTRMAAGSAFTSTYGDRSIRVKKLDNGGRLTIAMNRTTITVYFKWDEDYNGYTMYASCDLKITTIKSISKLIKTSTARYTRYGDFVGLSANDVNRIVDYIVKRLRSA